MMELVVMPGMSAKFRICRMRTANFKPVGGTLNGNFCAPKVRVPEYPFGGGFCMRGAPVRKKSTLRENCEFGSTIAAPSTSDGSRGNSSSPSNLIVET